MNAKELRRLSRIELLEMLMEQEKDNLALQAKTEQLEAKLRDRTISMSKAGSIAEAAFMLNGIFETAEATCSQYLENIRRLSDNQDAINAQRDAASQAKAQDLLSEATRRCNQLDTEAKKRCAQLEADTQSRCALLEAESKSRCAQAESETQNRCAQLEAETKKKCDDLIADTDRIVNEKWAQISQRLNALYSSHEGLLELVNFGLTLVPKRGADYETGTKPET